MLDRARNASAALGEDGESESRHRRDFDRLAAEWKVQARYLASLTAIASVPAYQEIVAMGRRAVPLILAELRREPDHWFVALKQITGSDPFVPDEARGDITAMARIWVKWGRDHGIAV